MKVKEESEKAGLELNIQKTSITTTGPITSSRVDRQKVETVANFIFLGSKITEDGDCNHEIKRRLLLGRKVMTNLDSMLKSRGITFSTKVCRVKCMIFPIVVYKCENWTLKKAECRKIDAFLSVVLEKTQRSPLDSKKIKPVDSKGSQLWIFVVRTDDAETEAPILWHLMQRADFF